MLFMGKLTISMAIFNSKLLVYQRVYPINIPLNPYKIPLNHHKIPLNPYKIPLNPYKIPLNHHKIPLNPYKIPLNPIEWVFDGTPSMSSVVQKVATGRSSASGFNRRLSRAAGVESGAVATSGRG